MSAPVVPNAELVQKAIRDRLDLVLPDNWTVYCRRDANLVVGDQFPLAYVIQLEPMVLESETDNRDLIGYRNGVILAVREATVKRTDPALGALKRTATAAVYTDQYPGLLIEDVRLDETAELPTPSFAFEQGYTSTGFMVTLGIVEARTPMEALP